MQSIRTDSQFFRDALARVSRPEEPRTARPPVAVGDERFAVDHQSPKAAPLERRDPGLDRVIGRLVSLNGTQAVISCPLKLDEGEWSVGHLITIVHRTSRVVGTICDV